MQQMTKKHTCEILFVLMLVVQLGGIIYSFMKKEGCHSDELWSYGYANFYYGGDIYNSNNELANQVYWNEWVDSQMFRDYLIVNENERFAYGSVYYNMKNGEHPPFHSMLLHTICSLFPGKFSLWYSFSINIVAFIVCMIFLYKLAGSAKDDYFALLCCGLYGFGQAARDTFIFLRMYALCTALLMIILYNGYIVISKYEKEQKIGRCNLIGLFVSCFLAFYTHFYMVAFMGMLTFFLCIYFLLKRQTKLLFIFGGAVLSALLCMLAAFPNTISRVLRHISEKQDKKELNYNFSIRLRLMLDFISRKDFGFNVSIYKSGWLPILFGILIYGCIIMIPVFYLCRKTKWILKVKAVFRYIVTHKREVVKKILAAVNWPYVITIITVVLQLIVVGATVNMYGMAPYEDRYIMYLYPVAVILMLGILEWICSFLFRKKRAGKAVLALLTCIVLVMNVRLSFKTEDPYFYKEEYKNKPLEQCIKGENVIFVTHGGWILVSLSDKMMGTNSFFRVHAEEYEMYTDEYCKKLEEGNLLLVINTEGYFEVDWSEKEVAMSDDFMKVVKYFENIEPDIVMEKVSEQTVFGRIYITYKISRR